MPLAYNGRFDRFGVQEGVSSEGGRREGCQGGGGCYSEKEWFLGGFVGKRGCGSKPFASRLFLQYLSLTNLTIGIFRFGFLGSRFFVIFVSCIVFQSSQSVGLWSAAACPHILCDLHRNQLSQSLGLWSAAACQLGLCELYHNQLSQSLGLWSAAAW